MDVAWHSTNVPVTMVGLERVARFLTVQLSISVLGRESVLQATCVAVTWDFWVQTAVKWLTAVSLQTVVGAVFVFQRSYSTCRAGNKQIHLPLVT